MNIYNNESSMVFLIHAVELSVVSAVPNQAFILQLRREPPTEEYSWQVQFVLCIHCVSLN